MEKPIFPRFKCLCTSKLLYRIRFASIKQKKNNNNQRYKLSERENFRKKRNSQRYTPRWRLHTNTEMWKTKFFIVRFVYLIQNCIQSTIWHWIVQCTLCLRPRPRAHAHVCIKRQERADLMIICSKISSTHEESKERHIAVALQFHA